ncbi:MAG: hypothetical protein E7302_03670 [Butyrivibrio sp.]|nr:hypothetical protein [Butyrivibrio sp.]
MKKFLGKLKWVFIVLLVLVIVMAIAFKSYTGNYYKADSNIINVVKNLFDATVHSYSNENGKVFIPVNQKPKAVIVFYPGGKVEYTAYDSLMYAIAAKGYCCLLPRMPENLAFFKIDAAKKITQGYEKDRELVGDIDWYLAGHSLGGVAAATYLGEQIDNGEYAGIILCASYTTTDFSNSGIRLLSIRGSEDKVLNMDNYENSKELWPKDSEEIVIDGGIHSYFGSYGIQSGDGTPSITNEAQISFTAQAIDNWIK